VRRVVSVIGELLGAAGMVLFIPIAILVVGIPLALSVRFVLWMAGALSGAEHPSAS